MINQEKIDRYLFVASNVLKDIEDDDMDWEYHQLLSFSTEWTYVCGAIQKLHILQAEMNEEQKRQYEILRQRVFVVEDRLEKLDLPNPFEKLRNQMAEKTITKCLVDVAWYLSDVEEIDLPWEEGQLAGFSVEWGIVYGMVSDLIDMHDQLNPDQMVEFDQLKQRFDVVSDRLEKLDLPNPFAPKCGG